MNKVFGKLTLTGKTGVFQYKYQKVASAEAKCQCGNVKYYNIYNLIHGKTTTCGTHDRKLYPFQGKMLYLKQISKITGFNINLLRERIRCKIPLDFPFHKIYHRENLFKKNSMAELGRKCGISRERVRQLIVKGLSKEQIIKRYEKNASY